MLSKTLVLILWVYIFHCKASAGDNCKKYLSDKNFQLIIDYANWRNIKHVVILEEDVKLGCNCKAFKNSLKNFSRNKLYLSLRTSINVGARPKNLKQKEIMVTFYKNHSQDIIEQANTLSANGETVSWLIILTSKQNYILDHLHFANFSLDVDVVIAVDTLWTRRGPYSQVVNQHRNDENNISMSDNQSNFGKSPNKYNRFLINTNLSTNLCNYCQIGSMPEWVTMNTYCMLQIYKIRRSYNDSLVVYPLGFWKLPSNSEFMKPFLNTEKRDNFFQFPILFGYKNSSHIINTENVVDEGDDNNDNGNMKEFMSSFCLILNSSKIISTYSKVGNKDNNGEWTDLIGAVIKEEVDLGLDAIISKPERSDDMVFTYHIMQYLWNIYIQPQESNDFRDAFLVPFNSTLILCVFGVAVVITIVMTIYSKIIVKVKKFRATNRGNGFFDSVIWCIGIITQQGSIWTPRSCSEQIIVIVSLAFTLLIYNSYSAFVTSILSVKRWDIRTVEDLLDSDYQIGYTKNSQDELYLRSTNITQLNQIYLRGYLDNNINNVSEGLLKASKGNYAFFASGHIARRELLVISKHRCIHDVAEIPVPYTENYIAFPMSKHCPYKKLINLSIIKMYESGIYKYIYRNLNPNLQMCEEPRTYQSAGVPDLSSAFGILFLGIILSVAFLICECIWKSKKRLYLSLRKSVCHGNRHMA